MNSSLRKKDRAKASLDYYLIQLLNFNQIV